MTSPSKDAFLYQSIHLHFDPTQAPHPSIWGSWKPWWNGRRRKKKRTRDMNYEILVGSLPIPSMYGIFTYIWLIFMVHVGKYAIHGSYGLGILLEIHGLSSIPYIHLASCSSPKKQQITLAALWVPSHLENDGFFQRMSPAPNAKLSSSIHSTHQAIHQAINPSPSQKHRKSSSHLSLQPPPSWMSQKVSKWLVSGL